MSLRDTLLAHLDAALARLRERGDISVDTWPRVALTPPKQKEHGDFTTPLALAVGRMVKRPPREIAELVRQELGEAEGLVARCEIAGPGYLNIFVSEAAWLDSLFDILKRGDEALTCPIDASRGRVLLEYVSANPTGPLHVAHARGAVHGDVLARLLTAAGTEVSREYYVNDMGRQTDIMAQSIYLRYQEILGRPFEAPKDFYPGAYITEIAQSIVDHHGAEYLDAPQSAWLQTFRAQGITAMLARIRADLNAFNVHFDSWVSEQAVCQPETLENVVSRLRQAGHIFVEDNKTWFRSTTFGDDKDRVVLRDDGRPTYFLTDLAYHDAKMQRGFKKLINIWGADHGGYVARVRAGLEALGHDGKALQCLLMQMVSLSSGGEAVKMGKRLGTAVWLQEVLDKAGTDATRYIFSMRRTDTQMDFDIDLAMQRSLENPVYYAQMGHARMAAIARRAHEDGIEPVTLDRAALDALILPEERAMLRTLARVPDLVVDAAAALEPHQVVHYMQDLIGQFHSYYTRYKHSEKVVSDNLATTKARLLMCQGMQHVLKFLLTLLGVQAPTHMSLADPEAPAAP